MKELSIEEKAKAYDEAINRMKHYVVDEYGCSRIKVVDVFPELAKSEDESIRKELINAFKEATDSLYMVLTPLKRDAFIAWLEKQGEHAKFRDSIQVGDKDTRNQDGVLVNLSQLNRVAKKDEKQGEQKPILDVEIPFGTDSELVEEAITIPDGCYAIIVDNKVILRKEEKKPSWSGEDEENLNWFEKFFRAESVIAEGKDIPQDRYLWFKNLKDRVQSKQEWSEEDKMQLDAAIHLVSSTGHIETANWLKSIKNRVLQKNITVTDEELAKAKKDAYNDALDKIEYHSDEPTFDDGWSAAIWYLKKKNARPQSPWKPSDEQLDSLYDVLNPCDGFNREVLESLYVQLKKLREEDV